MLSASRVVVQSFILPLVLVLAALSVLAGEPVELARGIAPNHPQQPQIVVDNNGSIHVVFGVGDVIHYCRSDDGGKSFVQPVGLPSVRDMSLGMRRGPRIATTQSAICVTAIGGKQGRGRDGDVLAVRSSDGGKTWADAVPVNDAHDSAREGLHAMAAGPRGEICCVWLDLRNGKTEVMASVSTDGGSAWSKNMLVYKSPDGSVCECCHPSIAYDEHGELYIMWRNSLAGSRDMYVATSSDGGKSFGQAAKLGSGTWPLKACPMDGGAIAAIAPGKTASAWRRDKSIYLFLDGRTQEQLLGTGEQPWIATAKDGPFVVWVAKRGDAAYLLTPAEKSPAQIAHNAADPVIATSLNGRGPVVSAWESRDGLNHSIQCKVVRD